MSVDKDFVIKNGIEVNENLIYGNIESQGVGIGTTEPVGKLDVRGDFYATGIASVSIAVTTGSIQASGFTTSIDGLNIGTGGTMVSVATSTRKMGIGSDSPAYTLDIGGPVSTGTTACFIFGDLTVTGNIDATELVGQISDGGTVGFSTVTVDNTLTAPLSESYHIFNVEDQSGVNYNFLAAGNEPQGIGFTQNTVNPTIFLQRGQGYRFNVNASGFPFQIKRDNLANINNRYDDGVEGNGSQVGIITFKVPYNAPDILFYQASNTATMGGEIRMVGVFTGTTINIDVPGIATITSAEITHLNVTGFSTLGGGGAEISQLEVTGFSTIGDASAGSINATGIITAASFIGIGRSSETVQIGERNDNVAYQVGFVTAAAGYRDFFVDDDAAQLTYNPSTSTLTASTFVGNLTGIATGADNIHVDEVNDAGPYQLLFTQQNSPDFQRARIDTDNTQLSYVPSTNTLSVANVSGTFLGTATNATNINVENTNGAGNRFLVFVDGAVTDVDERPQVDSNLTYNAQSNTLTAGDFSGSGDNLTDLNASQLTLGTVPGARGTAAGINSDTFVRYRGTTSTAGEFDGGTTDPTDTTRLNYNGQLHATGFTGPVTGNASSADQIKTQNADNNQNFVITFVDSNNATATNESLRTDGELLYNPSTNLLTVSGGSVNASGDSNNFGDTTLDDVTCDSLTVTGNTTLGNEASDITTINGDLRVTGDITAFFASDERLKSNITPIENGLEKILSLSGNTYDWNEKATKEGTEVGVIAQEVEALGLPGLVQTNGNGYLGVRYEKLVPILIEAVKDLSAKVEWLESQIGE